MVPLQPVVDVLRVNDWTERHVDALVLLHQREDAVEDVRLLEELVLQLIRRFDLIAVERTRGQGLETLVDSGGLIRKRFQTLFDFCESPVFGETHELDDAHEQTVLEVSKHAGGDLIV